MAEQYLGNLKGEAGYTPIKGVDYFDGKDGKDGQDGIGGGSGGGLTTEQVKRVKVNNAVDADTVGGKTIDVDRAYVNQIVGNISSLLDELNGEKS